MDLSLDHLRSFALARSFFAPTTLAGAIKRLGFVQADPIRAPARAQDLILRQRVKAYRAGDLERRYASLGVEEDFFVNYGFLPRSTQALMHPRTAKAAWSPERRAQAQAVLDFVRAQGVAHPREVDAAFAHGSARNWFGGSSRASTQLLDDMHYRGLLRIAGRVSGVRTYAAQEAFEAADPALAMQALIDVIVRQYAPLPERSLSELIGLLRGGAPQWAAQRQASLAHAKQRLASARVAGIHWYWPANEDPRAEPAGTRNVLRLLAPFDPLVWDRRRFELFWGWAYRFEAYTPPAKRVRGYYALPLLWRDQVVGWGNLAVRGGQLEAALGYVSGAAPRDPAFARALDAELARLRTFLALPAANTE
jgi:uncharacterized protein YcaQ